MNGQAMPSGRPASRADIAPQGARFFQMVSHTHKRGRHFWAELVDGTLPYENFVYNDPTRVLFDPPLAFDSSPGAGDGWCDACAITGGESTENEMFLLTGQYYIEEGFPQAPSDGPVYAGAASVR